MDAQPVADATSELVKQGLLGVVSSLLIGAVVALVRRNDKVNDDRIEDAKTFADRYAQLTEKSIEANKDATKVLEILREKIK